MLPDECDGIDKLQNVFEHFDPLNIQAVMDTQKNVTVMLPKFHIESLVNFNPILSEVMTSLIYVKF